MLFRRPLECLIGIAALVAGALLLHGCGSVPGSSPNSVAVACHVELVPYTTLEQDEAAAELGKLPPDSELARMLADYHTLREKCR